MGVRTAQNNPGLGMPNFSRGPFDPANIFTGASVGLGTIIEGYDDVANVTNEYIFLNAPAAVAAGNEVTYDATYTATVVAAPNGQAVALHNGAAGMQDWFRLKRRGVIA